MIESYFLNSHLEGYGRTIQIKEDETLIVCEAKFKNSQLNGPAKIYFSDGTIWKGSFLDDLRHGVSD